MADPDQRITGGRLNQAVANAVVRIHTRSVGRGPTKTQAFHRGNVIVVVMHEVLTQAEKTLASVGRDDVVMDMRRRLHELMGPEMAIAIEELSGCHVEAVLASSHVAPDLSAEVFVLDRAVAGQHAFGGDAEWG